ncbi:hypothetical protein Salat_2972800 [Sesamum alatum]|uniref:Uncharacterized protein n=1 Tax=Sesamum alatum TaxID=300844 RepID=A0AAE1XHQ5_9LAMI|nr:hypothetical protein Salat_2972800 [Sesamum alatum]
MVPRHFESRLRPLRLLVKAESHTQELGVRVKLKQPSPALSQSHEFKPGQAVHENLFLARLDRLIKKPPRHEKDSEAEMGENETSSVRKVQKDAGESSSSKANQRKSSTRRSSSLERYQIR